MSRVTECDCCKKIVRCNTAYVEIAKKQGCYRFDICNECYENLMKNYFHMRFDEKSCEWMNKELD